MVDYVKVEGLQQLGETLRGLAQDVRTKIARSATNAAAQVIKKQAITNAPQYPKVAKLQVGGKGSKEYIDVPPGTLKKNIVVKRNTKSELTSEHLVVVRGKRKDKFAARYGRLVEYGTQFTPPQSYMRSAFDQEKGFAVGKMKQAIEKGIAKVNKK